MERTSGRDSLKSTSAFIACLSIALAALAVRFYGIRYGLPFPLKTDEPYIIDSALGNFYSQNPIILGWPGSLLVLILFVFYSLYYFILKAGGTLSQVEDFIFMYWRDPTAFYLIGRLFVAITGAATVAVLFRTAHRLYDTTVSVLSSLFLTFAFMHVRHSHFALPDVPMTLLLIVLIFLSYRILKGAGSGTYITAGALCGLAASLKFNAAVIILPLLLAHLLRESSHEKQDWLNLTWMLGCIPVFFYLGCPYVLTDPKAMLASIREVVIRQKEIGNTRAIAVGHPLSYLFGTILPESTGYPMLVLSIAGAASALFKPTRKNVILLSYPILYILLLSTSRTMFLRYAIPLIPFMALFSANLITRLTRLIREGMLRTLTFAVLVLIILAPQAWKTLLFDHMLTRTDTRVTARKWIVEQLPERSSILLDHVPFSVPLGFNEWVLNYEMTGNRWGELKYRYLDRRSGEKINSYTLMYTSGELNENVWDSHPQYVIESSYVKNLFYGSSGKNLEMIRPESVRRRRTFYDEVEKRGELLMTFSPAGENEEAPDDVYGVAVNPEPGPVIMIYRMNGTHPDGSS